MELLLYKDLIIDFISQKNESEENQRLVNRIFENENSRFLSSKKFFQFIEDELEEDYKYDFQAVVKKMADNGENVKSSEITTTFDEEFLHIHQSSSKNVLISISFSEPNRNLLKDIPNFVVISNRKKPNYHWLVTQLAILHPNKVTVKSSTFKKDSEVKQFFDDVFKIPKTISRMNIFDRQTNRFTHNLFDSFKNNASIFYYTLDNRWNPLNKHTVKNAFKKLTIHVTKNKDDVHSRKLIFEGFELTSHHDFNDLLIGIDWEVDILFSWDEAKEQMTRCAKFRPFN
jgi:hypothetical protein